MIVVSAAVAGMAVLLMASCTGKLNVAMLYLIFFLNTRTVYNIVYYIEE